MATSAQYTITPLGPIVNLSQLVDVTVQARPLDDLYKNETYVGVIDEVKVNRFGTFAHFKGEGLNLAKWIKIDRIDGYAHLPTPTPAAAADQPAVEVAAIETPVIAAETPVSAQPAHMTDTGRETGRITYVNARSGYGYVQLDEGGEDFRFDLRNVYGGASAMNALSKGTSVTFVVRSGAGIAPAAIALVIPGHQASEEHYARSVARKAATPATPLPRPRRRSINEQVALKSANDKLAMFNAMAAVEALSQK